MAYKEKLWPRQQTPGRVQEPCRPSRSSVTEARSYRGKSVDRRYNLLSADPPPLAGCPRNGEYQIVETVTRRRFILLDRDGTVIVERNYLSDPAGVELARGAAAGLRRLAAAGFGLALITNQAGIARGYFDLDTLNRVHQRLIELLAAESVRLDGIYYCPHGPDDGCDCRKPRTGMVKQAARELGFDPQEAIMIGDNVGDIELGRRVGATTILVRTGYGATLESEGTVKPDFIRDDLGDAADLILSGPASGRTRSQDS